MKTLTTLALIAALVPAAAMAQGTPGAHFIESWDLDADGTVTSAEVTERRGDVFYMFDQDENGVLDAAEYVLFDETRAADMEANAEGHAQAGHKMQEGLTATFNDTDENGEVSKAEFLAGSDRWFAMIDRNADGVVTAADFGPKNH